MGLNIVYINVFHSTFTNVFFIFVPFFTFNVFKKYFWKGVTFMTQTAVKLFYS